MTSHFKRTGDALAFRQKFGKWLKARREELGKTQLDLGRVLKHEYPTTVSQFERGITRVPPEDWANYADLLEIETREFAKRALAHYDPVVFHLLFKPEESV